MIHINSPFWSLVVFGLAFIGSVKVLMWIDPALNAITEWISSLFKK